MREHFQNKGPNSVPKFHVIFGTLPCVLNYKSESGCKYGDMCRFRHVEVHVQAIKSRRKVGLFNWVFCLMILTRENLFYGKKEHVDQNTPSNSPRAHKIGCDIPLASRMPPFLHKEKDFVGFSLASFSSLPLRAHLRNALVTT